MQRSHIANIFAFTSGASNCKDLGLPFILAIIADLMKRFFQEIFGYRGKNPLLV